MFSRCVYLFFASALVSVLSTSTKLGGGVAAPLVVWGRNTSLKNKNTTFFCFFNCSVLGALTSLLHLCHHPTQLFAAAAGPHDNPTRMRSPPRLSAPARPATLSCQVTTPPALSSPLLAPERRARNPPDARAHSRARARSSPAGNVRRGRRERELKTFHSNPQTSGARAVARPPNGVRRPRAPV